MKRGRRFVHGDKELVEKLTKDEADAFNKLDADAKAAFIADKTKTEG